MGIAIRGCEDGDLDSVIAVWHRAKRASYPYLPTEQGRALHEDASFFRAHVAPRRTIWLASEGGATLGFLALEGRYIDRLYVDPEHQARGVGRALLDQAKQLSPGGLELHTHQQNVSACSFYEKHGFRAARYGASPPPESAPDVLYRWHP